MTPDQAEELRRLVRMLQVRTVRHFAVQRGLAGTGINAETFEGTLKGKVKARAELDAHIDRLTLEPFNQGAPNGSV